MRLRILFPVMAIAVAAWAQTPVVPPGSIVNGASFAAGQPITGGSLISIFGSNLATTQQHADSIPLSTSLGGVTVEFINGNTTINAPMLDTIPAAGQLNVQVPWDIVPPNTTQTVNVVVTVAGHGSSQPTPVSVGPFSPAVFAVGTQAVAVNNADGSLAWPTGSVSGVTSHPAKPGDVLILYATGIGALQTPVADGAAAGNQIISTLTQPTVLVGGITAQLVYSVLSPQFVGVDQLAIFVPNVPAGNTVPLQIQMGGITSPNTFTIAVEQ